MNVEKELQIIANLKAGRHWSKNDEDEQSRARQRFIDDARAEGWGEYWIGLVPPLAKDEAMPRTEAYYKKVLAMDDELIQEMLAEIAKLKSKVNRLEQKLSSARGVTNMTGP